MRKRIFWNVVFTAGFAVILTAVMLVTAMYGVYEERLSHELRIEADYIAHALDIAGGDLTYFEDLRSENRITLIAPDGKVLYDSDADSNQMENHAERPEVIQALQEGQGESTRKSDTFSTMTIYYAKKTGDGLVLRLANTRSSMLGTFANVFPLVICMLLCIVLIALLIARRTARWIVKPINTLNLDEPLENDAYDELAPLLTRMYRQHEQIQAQIQALENARTELAAVMENMREGMILLDTKDKVLSMNGSAARMFGVTQEAYIGQSFLSVNRDADLHDLIRHTLDGEEGEMVMELGGRNHQIFASPVMKENVVRGAVLLILDVTERFAAEESRREFTANVSHELKTPLTSISGFAEIIRDGIAQPQDVPGFASKICSESARLIALVNDILELSRLDEGKGHGKKETIPLQPLFQSLVEEFAPTAARKRLTLTLNAEDVQIFGYPVLIREIFFNLIDNAIKYTPEGGLVTVAAKNENDGICCSVSDNGIGIPPEHQAHVFERFYRVDKSHSRSTGGTGLGLAIVKHASQLHHAELNLASAEGKGTTVTLRFEK